MHGHLRQFLSRLNVCQECLNALSHVEQIIVGCLRNFCANTPPSQDPKVTSKFVRALALQCAEKPETACHKGHMNLGRLSDNFRQRLRMAQHHAMFYYVLLGGIWHTICPLANHGYIWGFLKMVDPQNYGFQYKNGLIWMI